RERHVPVHADLVAGQPGKFGKALDPNIHVDGAVGGAVDQGAVGEVQPGDLRDLRAAAEDHLGPLGQPGEVGAPSHGLGQLVEVDGEVQRQLDGAGDH